MDIEIKDFHDWIESPDSKKFYEKMESTDKENLIIAAHIAYNAGIEEGKKRVILKFSNFICLS